MKEIGWEPVLDQPAQHAEPGSSVQLLYATFSSLLIGAFRSGAISERSSRRRPTRCGEMTRLQGVVRSKTRRQGTVGLRVTLRSRPFPVRQWLLTCPFLPSWPLTRSFRGWTVRIDRHRALGLFLPCCFARRVPRGLGFSLLVALQTRPRRLYSCPIRLGGRQPSPAAPVDRPRAPLSFRAQAGSCDFAKMSSFARVEPLLALSRVRLQAVLLLGKGPGGSSTGRSCCLRFLGLAASQEELRRAFRGLRRFFGAPLGSRWSGCSTRADLSFGRRLSLGGGLTFHGESSGAAMRGASVPERSALRDRSSPRSASAGLFDFPGANPAVVEKSSKSRRSLSSRN